MVKLNEEEKKQKQAEDKTVEEAPTEKKATKKEVVKTIKTNASLEDLGVIFYPLVTEKAVNMIDSENKITFIVSDKATKPQIKKVVEHAYQIKTDKVNIIRDRKGRKKAIVKLKKEFKAQDLATKLGVL
jgi:large subunit ribosomal protein L23